MWRSSGAKATPGFSSRSSDRDAGAWLSWLERRLHRSSGPSGSPDQDFPGHAGPGRDKVLRSDREQSCAVASGAKRLSADSSMGRRLTADGCGAVLGVTRLDAGPVAAIG